MKTDSSLRFKKKLEPVVLWFYFFEKLQTQGWSWLKLVVINEVKYPPDSGAN